MPGFDDQSVRRIARTVQVSERRLRGRRQKRGRWNGKGGGGGLLLVKLDAALAWNDSTGVSGVVWEGTPEAASARTLEGIVAIPKITTSGTFAADSFVLVQRKDGRWKVIGAPCT